MMEMDVDDFIYNSVYSYERYLLLSLSVYVVLYMVTIIVIITIITITTIINYCYYYCCYYYYYCYYHYYCCFYFRYHLLNKLSLWLFDFWEVSVFC